MNINDSKHVFIEHPLPPLYDKNSRILILGSFPSIKTRAAGFFYGHPQNRFWPMLSALLQIEPPLKATEPKRATEVLLRRRIALWDSISSCEIIGSSDSSIRNVKPNNFDAIFSAAQIRHVFCNGAAAYNYFLKHQDLPTAVGLSRMPSTSPANAAKSLDALIKDWSVILDYLD
ncbi:MAG TPA: DNA-deoxyinosine glycosylase [Clostridiaceae bacterium]|nr:DNA-deoxyinosine glycosylase [Clostridiaceae bacterium]